MNVNLSKIDLINKNVSPRRTLNSIQQKITPQSVKKAVKTAGMAGLAGLAIYGMASCSRPNLKADVWLEVPKTKITVQDDKLIAEMKSADKYKKAFHKAKNDLLSAKSILKNDQNELKQIKLTLKRANVDAETKEYLKQQSIVLEDFIQIDNKNIEDYEKTFIKAKNDYEKNGNPSVIELY